MKALTDYIKWTKDNPHQVGFLVKQAVKRTEKLIKKSKQKDSDIYFDVDEVENLFLFAESQLQIIFHDELQFLKLYPWQRFILGNIYGWKYKSSNARLYKKAFISVAKKNGKSTLMAVPVLYDLYSRPQAQIYLAALNKEHTENVFNPIYDSLLNNKDMMMEVDISKKHKSVVHLEHNGFIKTLSKGYESKQGIKPTLAVIDEYYLYKNNELFDILEKGQKSVNNPLLLVITTNGKDKNTPYWQYYEHGRNIVKGIEEDDSTFFISYEIDDEDDYTLAGNLIKANPMLQHTLDFNQDFKSELKQILQIPDKKYSFLQFTCNKWTDYSNEKWIPDELFVKNCSQKEPDDDYLKTLPSVLTLDLSQIHDFTVLTQMFRDIEKDKYYTRHYFFFPEDSMAVKIQENISLQSWVEAGLITPTTGSVVDYSFIIKKAEELFDKYDVRLLGYDKWHIKELLPYLNDNIPTVKFEQNLSNLASPTKAYELAISKKQLVENNPVIRWMLSTCTIKPDANGNYRPLKINDKSRIDGIITSVMAMDLLNNIANEPKPTTYDFDELMTLIKV